ncbi:MAG: RidA family protein [Alphaproteobacteria bacterium]|jgi:2-iminobutanoate/2-iminopropanoate deaminase
MNKRLNPDTMPSPASRYAQLVEVPGGSRLVVISGQVPLRRDGSLPDGFEAQATQVYENIMAALAAIDMDPGDLVKLTSFITDQANVGKLRGVRDSFLQGHECASTLLVVAGLASPDWLVEIEAIAAKD